MIEKVEEIKEILFLIKEDIGSYYAELEEDEKTERLECACKMNALDYAIDCINKLELLKNKMG